MAYLGQWYSDMGAEKTINDPARFIVVKHITGAEDMICEYPIISIHSFNSDYTSAKDLSLEVHAHMKALTPKTSVVVNGITYGVDHRNVEEAPHEVDYDDKNLRRFVARYELGLRLQ